MFKLLKYLIYIIFSVPFLFALALLTPWGDEAFYGYVNQIASKKAGVQIEIQKVDPFNYPQIYLKAKIANNLFIRLKGSYQEKVFDVNYTLKTSFIPLKKRLIKDRVNIAGHIGGKKEKLFITGKGTGLEGAISFYTTKEKKIFKKSHIELLQVNAEKLFHLFKEKPYLKDKADIVADFSFITKKSQIGTLHYKSIEKLALPIGFKVEASGDINGTQYHFQGDIYNHFSHLKIFKGAYQKESKITHASYILKVNDLKNLKPLFKKQYNGNLFVQGEIKDIHHNLKITGSSKSYGGLLDFIYKDDSVKLHLNNLLFQNITYFFNTDPILNAKVNGTIFYHIPLNRFDVNTTLKDIIISHKKTLYNVYEKSGVNLKNTLFDRGLLQFNYEKGLSSGQLKLQNPYEHLYLTKTHIDSQLNTIRGDFDVKIRKYAFSGEIYGALDRPEYKLNMSELMIHEIKTRMDTFMGKDNRKLIEGMPMGDVAEDIAGDMGGDFMNMMFGK